MRYAFDNYQDTFLDQKVRKWRLFFNEVYSKAIICKFIMHDLSAVVLLLTNEQLVVQLFYDGLSKILKRLKWR